MEWFEEFFSHEYLRFDRHEETPGEVDFLEKVLDLEPGARILDLCCGYGRHAIELAARGYTVTGYDLSPVLLGKAWGDATARKVTVQWIRGDMRDLDERETYHAVISMFTSFGYFQEETENFDVLKRIAQALLPEGSFLIETVNRDFLIRHFLPQEWFRVADDLWVLERRSFDLVESRSEVEVTVIEEGVEKRFRHSVRVYSFTELQLLLASVGLITQGVWGGFIGEDATWDASRMIVLAKKEGNYSPQRTGQGQRVQRVGAASPRKETRA
ncbi:MAG: class I SAM-dependent methyltransferase [Candidatus Latescibacteria bacterium]|nr:class I SAM-dependent methyltransferase [Candidatus Latescibacterota bacterium]